MQGKTWTTAWYWGASTETRLQRTRIPIRPLAIPDRVGRMFSELRWAIHMPPWMEHQPQSWISTETWILIDTRIVAHQHLYQWIYQALSRAIKVGLQEDRGR